MSKCINASWSPCISISCGCDCECVCARNIRYGTIGASIPPIRRDGTVHLGQLKAGYEWRLFKTLDSRIVALGVSSDKLPIKATICATGITYEDIKL